MVLCCKTVIFSIFFISLLLIFFGFFYFTSFSTGVWGEGESWSSVFVLKVCVFTSLCCLVLFLLNGGEKISSDWLWFGPKTGALSVSLDFYFFLFFFVASFVSWSILEFSVYYMSGDPFRSGFYRLLLVFLLKMLLLTCSDSLFVFFIGWEGVGFLSFILIGWWKTRVDAQSSSLQAVLYNRIGDVGVMLMIFFSVSFYNSWSFTEVFLLKSGGELRFFVFLGLLAAVGKSAQFGFHPWLPAAMEGPTPVSALLHSSTMVVAGVFLLVRMTSLNFVDSLFFDFCLFMGGLTSVFAATTACFQYDFKKVVAYSTTSQLGLMVGSVGLGLPILAFFHICTHAFFKALLFLCSGSVIHSFGKEQDLRKVGNLSSVLPMSFSCFFMSSISLVGFPFFSGFYSKDVMLEGLSGSSFSTLGLGFMVLSTFFTAYYSGRLVFFCLGGGGYSGLNPVSEENSNLVMPMVRLLFGVFLFGFFFSKGLEVDFLLPSYFFKLSPLFLTIVGGFYGLVNLSLKSVVGLYMSRFFSGQWMYVFFVHQISSFFSSFFSNILSIFDRLFISLVPEGGGSFTVFFTRFYTRTFQSWKMSWQISFIFLLFLPFTKVFLF